MFNVESYMFCDYNDIDKIISKFLGKEYQLLVEQEMGTSQYTCYWPMKIKDYGDDEGYALALEDIEKFKSGEEVYIDFEALTWVMAKEGLLAEGNYMVRISW